MTGLNLVRHPDGNQDCRPVSFRRVRQTGVIPAKAANSDVIPAQAGIQCLSTAAKTLDSGFRRNDRCF
jgi:hypothetical protein